MGGGSREKLDQTCINLAIQVEQPVWDWLRLGATVSAQNRKAAPAGGFDFELVD